MDTNIGHFADVETYRPKVLELATAVGVTIPLTMDVHFIWMPFMIQLLIDLEHAREGIDLLQKQIDALEPKEEVKTDEPIQPRRERVYRGRGKTHKKGLGKKDMAPPILVEAGMVEAQV